MDDCLIGMGFTLEVVKKMTPRRLPCAFIGKCIPSAYSAVPTSSLGTAL